MAVRKSCKGYTLVEISISVLVIGIGLVSVLSIFPVGIRWTRKANSNVSGSITAKSLFNGMCADGNYLPLGPAAPATAIPLATKFEHNNYYFYVAKKPGVPERITINCYSSDYTSGQFSNTNDFVGTFEGFAP